MIFLMHTDFLPDLALPIFPAKVGQIKVEKAFKGLRWLSFSAVRGGGFP